MLAALIQPAVTLKAVVSLRSTNPHRTALMRVREAQRRETPRYVWVPYDHIPPHLRRAVVSGEDIYFFTHHGIDLRALRLALAENLSQGRIVRGGSTISQQLAKNLFLSEARTPLRKLQELVITVELETLLDKKRILELYLNVIEWGDGVFGCEAAAAHYFGKPVHGLTEDEALTLAAIIPTARGCDPLDRCASRIGDRTKRIRSLLGHPLLRPTF